MRKLLASLLFAAACGPLSPRPTGPPPAPTTPATTPATSEPRWSPTPLRLCAWNVRKLGHGHSTDYDLVARVIEQSCDLIAIVEVMQKQGGHPGHDALLESLRGGEASGAAQWSALVTDTPRPRTRSGSAEYYAVLWRDDLLEPCDQGGLRYHHDHDGSDEGSGADLFRREPAFGCFRSRLHPPGQAGWRGPDFALAAYHARWEGGDATAIVGEVSHLPDVFAAMAAAYPGERDLWLLGDLNLRPEQLTVLAPARDMTAVEAGAGHGSTLNRDGERTDNLYDHLVVRDPTASSELLGPARVVDVRSLAASPAEFFEQVSDHLPLVVHLDPAVADDD